MFNPMGEKAGIEPNLFTLPIYNCHTALKFPTTDLLQINLLSFSERKIEKVKQFLF